MSEFQGKTVLVTGGSRGIGRATGLAFGAAGAHVTLTSRDGPSDPEALRAAFAAIGAPAPRFADADVAQQGDTETLIEATGPVDILVSNAAFAPSVGRVENYRRRDFLRTIEYCAWPIVDHCQAIHARHGRYPSAVVALSSVGHLRYIPDYDAIAVAKSALETLVRYLAHRLGPDGTRVNAIRAGFVDTDALEGVLGEARLALLRRRAPQMILSPETVAQAVLGLCSAYFAGVNGQIITVDGGTGFADSLVDLPADPEV
ncbi:MAG: SDR family oxidoreductase [Pseudomonadota bacterium]